MILPPSGSYEHVSEMMNFNEEEEEEKLKRHRFSQQGKKSEGKQVSSSDWIQSVIQ